MKCDILLDMFSFVISVAVPLCVYMVAHKLLGSHPKDRWLLITACLLFFVSYFLPSPLVHGTHTQYMTHLVGGGLFCGFLWLYILRVQGLHYTALQEVVSLFVLVSALGVANELFETVLFWAGFMPYGIQDTSWDLVANTTGALLFYLTYKAGQWLRLV